MAVITNKKTIFFVTSPRSPHKLIDEVKFLVENFEGKQWNNKTQKEFYLALSKQDFFEGSPTGDIAFKARDRINRAPKALGLVDLKPKIKLTDAGKEFIYGNRPEEIFTRQLIKFQLHSPYHKDENNEFNIKPYLELMRLIDELDGLTKHEIALFVMGLTNYIKYDRTKENIIKFREEKITLREKQISYKSFVSNKFTETLTKLFETEISEGNISIRENDEQSLKKFISTKRRNHLDYADASIRYLRATSIFSLNPRSSKIYAVKEHKNDLDYILKTVERSIFQYSDEENYEEYLFNKNLPELLSDDKEKLLEKIVELGSGKIATKALRDKTIKELKNIKDELIKERVGNIIETEKEKLKTYEEYEDILKVFEDIENRENVDPSLFFEWNVWRAFAMLNDGNIQGNFRIDDDGMPLYTAPPNTADITCEYTGFDAIVEVTLSSGHKQYEMEGEPVARHYGNFKKKSNKDKVFGIFVAPKLSEATIAHYFLLYRSNIEYYGGKAKIIPLSLDDLRTLLTNAYNSKDKPKASSLRELFDELSSYADQSSSEKEWYQKINTKVQKAFV